MSMSACQARILCFLLRLNSIHRSYQAVFGHFIENQPIHRSTAQPACLLQNVCDAARHCMQACNVTVCLALDPEQTH